MFADLVATAARRSGGGHSSEGGDGPVANRDDNGRRRWQHTGYDSAEEAETEEEEEDYPLPTGNTPLVGTAYSSPLTDMRGQRPGSSEFRSPISATGGTASITSAMASPSSPPKAATASSPAPAVSASAAAAPQQGFTARGPLHPDRLHRPPSPVFSYAPSQVDSSALTSRASTPQASPRHVLGTFSLLAAEADEGEASLRGLPLAPLLGEEDEDAEVVLRSGTREQQQVLDDPVAEASTAAASCSSSATSTPCAPPLGTPPGSAMKPPRGAGAVTTAVVVAERDAVPRPGATSPLRFRVLYTEEEHRVQLETHETEERRCLFAAHRAIQSVYRMWAAEGAVADYGDAQAVAWPLLDLPARSPALLNDRTHTASAPNSALSSSHRDSTPPAAFVSGAASVDRVRSYVNSSVYSARSRRGGESESEPALAIGVAAHHAAVPTPRTYGYPSTHASMTDGPPSVALHNSHTSGTSSPAASRVLEYSALQGQQYHQQQQPQRAADAHSLPRKQPPSSRRFSPWRSDQPVAWHSHTSWAAPQRVSLVPHLVSTSPEAVHRASASSAASAGAWRRERIEPWRSPETRPAAAPRERESVGALGRAPSARGFSPSPRVLVNSDLDGFMLQTDPVLVDQHRHDDVLSRATPSWKASGNLESTSAASRHLCPVATAADPDREAGALGYSPNEAFRHRQRAVAQGASTSSLPRSPREDDAARRHERLTGYVQYKRFFDAVYGAGSEQRGATPLPLHPPQAAAWGPPAARTTTVSSSSSALPRSRTPAAAAAAAPAATWRAPSPELRSRAAPAPSRRHELVAARPALATPRGLSTAPPVTALADAALFTARLTRLSTLEMLCRAELQRRWIEDQNVLLHSFIMEGTAVLQQGRDTSGPLARRSSAESGHAMAPAWRFGRRADAA